MMNLTAVVCLFAFCYDLITFPQPPLEKKLSFIITRDRHLWAMLDINETSVPRIPRFSLDEDGYAMATHNGPFSLTFASIENATYFGFNSLTSHATATTNATSILRGSSPTHNQSGHGAHKWVGGATINFHRVYNGECEEHGKTLPTITHAINMYLANSTILAHKSFPVTVHGKLNTLVVWSNNYLLLTQTYWAHTHLVCVSPIPLWLAPILLIGIVFTSVISWMGINVSKKRRSTIV